jgi:hypothetical protein
MRPSVDDLLRGDGRLKGYKLVIVLFIIGPAVLVAFEHPHGFVRSYIDIMLFAFSWPLLVLVVLYVLRRLLVLRLAQQGRECHGVIKSISRGGRGTVWVTAAVLVRVEGEEMVLDVDLPDRLDDVSLNSEVILLLDPVKMRKAVILAKANT